MCFTPNFSFADKKMIMTQAPQHRIFPIVVLYQVELHASATYQSLLTQDGVGDFLVYDNSPADFAGTADLPRGAVYVRDVRNGGLPAAYNHGARLAAERGYSHILLLDSDTTFPDGAWQIYTEHLDDEVLMGPALRLADGCPFSPCDVSGWFIRGVDLNPGMYDLKHYHLVNSGLCIPLLLFQKIGGYAPQVRLDFSDFQFQQSALRFSSSVLLLPFTALQDFSNEEQDTQKLLRRYRLYLQSARYCRFATLHRCLRHHLGIWRHTLALTLRQRSIQFLRVYFETVLSWGAGDGPSAQ